MNKLLITGSTGFIGTYISRYFKQTYDCFGVSRASKIDISIMIREALGFETEEEALLQKLILLDYIRTKFKQKQIEDQKYFYRKLPEVSGIIKKYKKDYPEVLL